MVIALSSFLLLVAGCEIRAAQIGPGDNTRFRHRQLASTTNIIFTASGGTPPYTWSVTTPASAQSPETTPTQSTQPSRAWTEWRGCDRFRYKYCYRNSYTRLRNNEPRIDDNTSFHHCRRVRHKQHRLHRQRQQSALHMGGQQPQPRGLERGQEQRCLHNFEVTGQNSIVVSDRCPTLFPQPSYKNSPDYSATDSHWNEGVRLGSLEV